MVDSFFTAEIEDSMDGMELLKVEGFPKVSEIVLRETIPDLLNDPSSFVLYSPSALRELGIDSPSGDHALSSRELSIDMQKLAEIHLPRDTKRIIGFGAGQICDITKYLGYVYEIPSVLIPSAASTNSFATPFSTLAKHGDLTKTTVKTGYAAEVLFDPEFLGKHKENFLGLADVLSIAIALDDWDRALRIDSNVRNDHTYNMARAILDDCMSAVKDGNGDLNPEILMTLIMNSGIITAIHGDGTPESGAEHVFSKSFELYLGAWDLHMMHGRAVSLGILLMGQLQENRYFGQLSAIIQNLNFLNIERDQVLANRGVLEQSLNDVLGKLEPHAIRHTVVDERLSDIHNKAFREDLVNSTLSQFVYTN